MPACAGVTTTSFQDVGSPLCRLVAAVAALATDSDRHASAGLQLTAVAAVIAATLIIDARRAPAKAPSHI
jgi:hypothetical protein